jgi:phospholipid-translocating ATPase
MRLTGQVTPVLNEMGGLEYQAASPDEVAIVKFTQLVGITLISRDIHSIKLKTPSGYLEFEILDIFPFRSETKRMGIILRERHDFYFFEKGADSIMSPLLSRNDWVDEECANYAREGLRTLVVARKRLTAESYNQFKQKLVEAEASMSQRNEQIQGVIAKYLEKDLEPLGVTGVEDKLQVG